MKKEFLITNTRILKFSEYIKEDDGGGGVAFATPNANGSGNIVAPTIGTTPGSVWQSGSGIIGSGDRVSYDTGKKFEPFTRKKKVKYSLKKKIKNKKK